MLREATGSGLDGGPNKNASRPAEPMSRRRTARRKPVIRARRPGECGTADDAGVAPVAEGRGSGAEPRCGVREYLESR